MSETLYLLWYFQRLGDFATFGGWEIVHDSIDVISALLVFRDESHVVVGIAGLETVVTLGGAG